MRTLIRPAAAGIVTLVLLLTSALPAQASARLWHSHGGSQTECNAQLKRSAGGLVAQGWVIGSTTPCSPSQYIKGQWTGSFTYSR
ncbi:hypothetical protein ACHAAC_03725 [Aeromicrobium sp. CF4.19]|uniref:hypothetical protein n=1 Tax=Aeromicrobium sp. CF4.19 TaxID=3373082 RepID=UPI003EE527F7